MAHIDQPVRTQALLIQLDVKECVMQDDTKRTDIDLNKLREVIERCNVVLTERKSGQCLSCHI